MEQVPKWTNRFFSSVCYRQKEKPRPFLQLLLRSSLQAESRAEAMPGAARVLW